MSAPGRRFTCTACDFEAVNWVLRFPPIYRLPDGAKIYAPWGYGWCHDCRNVKGIAKGLSPVALKKRCEDLRAALPPKGPPSRFRFFAKREDPSTERTRSELAETEQYVSMLAGRPSLPICIDCGSTAVEESVPNTHPGCGGNFVFSETELRLQSNAPEKILLPAFAD